MATRNRGERHRHRNLRVIIIGTGFSGLGAAIALQKAGINYTILEKADSVGGTWRENTYPGCQCDIPSSVYQYSFYQKKDWTKTWSPQPEIRAYLEDVTDHFKLRSHIRFGVHVDEAKWDDHKKVWHVYTKDGQKFVADYLISGAGALHIPSIPDFEGLDTFEGPSFHSAEWRDDVSLTGKRVAVIGTGASSIQIVPEIVGKVGELQLYQRTPAWVMPWTNFKIPGPMKWAFGHVPGMHSLWREFWFSWHEIIGIAMTHHQWLLKLVEWMGKYNIYKNIRDPELRRKVTPNYPGGATRILKDANYYKALAQDNCQVITEGIDRFTKGSIVTKDGVFHRVDVVIFATGFHVTDSYKWLRLTGRHGEDLIARADRDGVISHKGVMFAGVPNAFILMGPNSGLGHNSMVQIIENQINYVVQAIQYAVKEGYREICPTQKATDTWNKKVQSNLARSVWNTAKVRSWYFDEHEKNRVLYDGTVRQHTREMKRFNPDEFERLR